MAASTQNIAPSTFLFLYCQVLRVDLPNIDNIERPSSQTPPGRVLWRVSAILAQPTGVHRFIIGLPCV